MNNDICFAKNGVVFNYRVAAIIRHNNKLLVQKSTKVSHVTVLGGRCNLDEDSASAIKREIKEETGFDVTIIKELGIVENFFTSSFDNKKYHEILIVYEVEFKDKNAYNLESIKSLEEDHEKYLNYVWLEIDELKQMAFHPSILLEMLDNSTFTHLIYKDEK